VFSLKFSSWAYVRLKGVDYSRIFTVSETGIPGCASFNEGLTTHMGRVREIVSLDFIDRFISRGQATITLDTAKGPCSISLSKHDEGKRGESLKIALGIVAPGVQEQCEILDPEDYRGLRYRGVDLRNKILPIVENLFEALPNKSQRVEARGLGCLFAWVPGFTRRS